MDLITYALLKKGSQGGGDSPSPSESAITIGSNGNWFIKGIDTGLVADPKKNLVDVDGILKVDTKNQKIVVVKNDTETIVGEYTTKIALDDINRLFTE